MILEKMNKLGSQKKPFLFILDYKLEKPIILELDKINPNKILFDINGFSNVQNRTEPKNRKKASLDTIPISYKQYLEKFNRVEEELKKGNSYLLNLTQPTKIKTNYSLKEIFINSNAKYRLWIKNKLVLFSPECFLKIENGKIKSYPMKGTIDASITNAEEILRNNEKERAEHITIVDLIRNDLNKVATNVKVEKFRYIERVQTQLGALLQVSSQISGTVEKKFGSKLGDIFKQLLPAGSITGAPKKKTREIIEEIEGYSRGYYTGVFGYFDGEKVESSVMIRIIEKENDKIFYKSGGGITIYSNPHDEYRELIDKIYLPFKAEH